MSWLHTHRFLLLRRLTQLTVLLLFWLGARGQLQLLTGNLSSSRLLARIPLADPFATLQILATGHVPESTLLVGAALVLGAWILLGGRSFCAWVCPVEPLADMAARLRRRAGELPVLRVPRGARYAVLGLALGLSALLGVAAFEAVSPIGLLQRGLISGSGLGLVVIPWLLVLDACVLRHGWCGSLCPLGAFYALVGRVSLARIGFDAARCDRCGKCVKVCPEPQVLHFERIGARGLIAAGECLNCARCIEVCPRDAFAVTTRLATREIERRSPCEGT